MGLRHPVSALVLAALASVLSAALGRAETIVLTDGRSLEAESVWPQGGELRYRTSDGGLFAVPRALVARVESGGATVTPVDPDLARSRERLADGDAPEALRLARLAVFREPRSLPALQALSEAQLAVGDARRASDSAEQALAADPRNARSHELLADALAELADFVGAREQYRMALELDPSPAVQRKLETLFASAVSSSSARLQIVYDGASDEPLGLAVLRVLDAAWAEYEKRLGFAPERAVTVVLQTETSFRDTTRAPEWAAAWNDGSIRVPVMGLQAPTPGLVRVLRHELAHSFVAARAAGCPTWLHEGIAQWLEGRDVARDDAELARAIATGTPLPRLESLETPFLGLTVSEATTAYAASLSAVVHIMRLRGEPGLRQLVDALAQGRPAAEALPIAIAMSYGELQADWERNLRRRAPKLAEQPKAGRP